jgi:signal transduction histidine kinase
VSAPDRWRRRDAPFTGLATTPEELAYERAWRQVRSMRRFYKHLIIYVAVVTGLCVVNLITAPHRLWFIFPAAGWGFGLLIHGVAVWGGAFWLGREWEEKKIQQLLAREKIRSLSTEKQLAEARLRLLQAQIEPHFLFNTLANVVSLIDPAPAKARMMLENFIAYLRGSLAASRLVQGTFEQEVKLLRHYLDLLKIRMGDRLRYTLDIEPSIMAEPLAPMLLQPIVENAIRHGLEPKIEGGEVRLSAKRIGERIEVRVQDDGMGFRPGADAGMGLENLRERLLVLYDGQASLKVEEAHPGTQVIIDIPTQQSHKS